MPLSISRQTSRSGDWVCEHCDYAANPARLPACEMCDTPRPKKITRQNRSKVPPVRALSFLQRCKNCGTDNPEMIIDYERGETICANCGLVFSNILYDEKGGSRGNRTEGAPRDRVADKREDIKLKRTFTPRRNVSSDFDPSSITASENEQGKVEPEEVVVTRVDNIKAEQSAKRQLNAATATMRTAAARTHLPPTAVNEGARLFHQLLGSPDTNLKGRDFKAVVAATLLLSLRRLGISRTFREISGLMDVAPGKINTAQKYILKQVPSLKKELDQSSNRRNPSDDIDRFCSRLDFTLNTKVRLAARSIADAVSSKDIALSKSPVTIAATSIVWALIIHKVEGMTVKHVMNAMGVSRNTLSQCHGLFYNDRPKVVSLLPTPTSQYTAVIPKLLPSESSDFSTAHAKSQGEGGG